MPQPDRPTMEMNSCFSTRRSIDDKAFTGPPSPGNVTSTELSDIAAVIGLEARPRRPALLPENALYCLPSSHRHQMLLGFALSVPAFDPPLEGFDHRHKPPFRMRSPRQARQTDRSVSRFTSPMIMR